jgi:hypothetical protein
MYLSGKILGLFLKTGHLKQPVFQPPSAGRCGAGSAGRCGAGAPHRHRDGQRMWWLCGGSAGLALLPCVGPRQVTTSNCVNTMANRWVIQLLPAFYY